MSLSLISARYCPLDRYLESAILMANWKACIVNFLEEKICRRNSGKNIENKLIYSLYLIIKLLQAPRLINVY